MKNLIQKHLRESFFVTPKSGMNFSGVLTSADRNYYAFADVMVHPPDNDPQPAKGELFVQRDNVAYLQRLQNVDR